MKPVRILVLGDIVGRPGRMACRDHLKEWRDKLGIDLIIANGENASGGNGLTVKNAGELFEYGIDFITSGNHIWKQKDYPELFEKYPNVIRPANYPSSNPGKGWGIVKTREGNEVAVVNLQGQVFMDPIDSPFTAADKCLVEIGDSIKFIIVDFHAEATSERMAMGLYLDGRVSAVLGTHTHVQSADERILAGGTAYQTDIGMVGPWNSVLGVDKDSILKKFTTGLPVRFEVAEGTVIACGTVVTINDSGRADEIQRFREILES